MRKIFLYLTILILLFCAFIYYLKRSNLEFVVHFKLLPRTAVSEIGGGKIGVATEDGAFVFKSIPRTWVLKFVHPESNSLVRPISIRKWFFPPVLDYVEAQTSEQTYPNMQVHMYDERRLSFEPQTILIPGGKFFMGVQKGEGPFNSVGVHEVWLDDYAISKYEITNKQYGAFIKDTRYQTEAQGVGGYISDGQGLWEWDRSASWKKPFKNYKRPVHFNRLPVVMVSWRDAYEYTKWLSRKTKKRYRLPTEAEWEKAARGQDGRFYPWGDNWENLDSYCNHGSYKKGCEPGMGDDGDGYQLLAPVDAFPKGISPYGVYNMVGNVKEWVRDKFSKYQRIEDKKINPTGPEKSAREIEVFLNMKFIGPQRVLRGGGWYDSLGYGLTATYRNAHNEQLRFSGVGFRVVEEISK